jgi:OOP family OmpA-OmpF porin
LLAPFALRAQALSTPTFDVERLSLDPSGVGSLVVGGGFTLPEGTLRLAIAGQYERNPLIVRANGTTPGALIANRVTAHLVAAFGVTDRLEFGFEVPMVAYQNGDDLKAYGLAPIESAGLGNPLLNARYSLLSTTRDAPVNLAIGLALGLPFGSPAALGGAGGSGTSLEPQVQVSRQIGPVLTSIEAGLLIRASQAIDSRRVGTELELQAAGGLTEVAFRPELILRTGVPFTGGIPAGFEAMLAARHEVGIPQLEAFGLVGMGVGALPGTPVFRALLGLSWRPDFGKTPPPPEPGAALKCPSPPPPVCPTCPVVAGSPAVKVDPCSPGAAHTPTQCPRLDDDGDGVANQDDQCPTVKGAAANHGCPAPDRDHDGVADVDDSCPDQAGPAENLGCPVRDSDKDGVPDAIDNCPAVPGPASNHGCPAATPQTVSIERERVSRIRSRIKLQLTVNFDTAKAAIQASSFNSLDQLAALLIAHPELKKLTIEGHTDNAGKAATNVKLSGARAAAVQGYLVKHGVKADRLAFRGLGPEKPIDTNDTEAGRARNRRVEIVSADEGAE